MNENGGLLNYRMCIKQNFYNYKFVFLNSCCEKKLALRNLGQSQLKKKVILRTDDVCTVLSTTTQLHPVAKTRFSVHCTRLF